MASPELFDRFPDLDSAKAKALEPSMSPTALKVRLLQRIVEQEAQIQALKDRLDSAGIP